MPFRTNDCERSCAAITVSSSSETPREPTLTFFAREHYIQLKC